jgi:hypothetical protein
MSQGFSVLPVELRLQVYGHLIAASMADGKIIEMGGMLFSCREIYSEMNTNCISSVRPILDRMDNWTAAQPGRAPLLIQFPVGYNFVKPPTEATLSIPVEVPTEPKYYSSIAEKRATAASRVFADFLLLPWTTLIIAIHVSQEQISQQGKPMCSGCMSRLYSYMLIQMGETTPDDIIMRTTQDGILMRSIEPFNDFETLAEHVHERQGSEHDTTKFPHNLWSDVESDVESSVESDVESSVESDVGPSTSPETDSNIPSGKRLELP